jgi:hypothetical protein
MWLYGSHLLVSGSEDESVDAEGRLGLVAPRYSFVLYVSSSGVNQSYLYQASLLVRS